MHEETSVARQPVRTPRYDVAERPFIIIWEVTRACDPFEPATRRAILLTKSPPSASLHRSSF
jgi:hypothetical protein